MKLLVVEDAADVRLVLVATLKRFGYQVSQAADGAEGLAILKQEKDIQLVVSDWAMPVMDGFELCQQLKQGQVIDRFIYFIMFSSNDDEERIISGLEVGADDFIAKQAPRAELNARIRAGGRIIELHNQLQRKQEKLEKAYASIENDVMQAAEMHARLLPTIKALPGVKFAWHAVSSAFLGGDMFDYLELDERHVAFYLLDVSGHGLPAALLSFTLKHVLSPSQQGRSLMKPPLASAPFYYVADPAEVVAKLNDRFQSDDEQYFTMVSGVLNTETGSLSLCQAGHPGPLHQNGEEIIEHHRNGFPVGMLPELDYESYQVQLAPGDRLFLYSDGASECFNAARQEFGVERLMGTLKEGQRLDLESQLQRLKQRLALWNQGPDFDDDVSVLAIEWLGNKEK
ncbi:PP2C family protein-serine/threonine phosphatase [Ferrimonas futtsuensis]|uniref:PP2C family protein-serine/threonine phosphatase n=1 Tax=Ferrimonas futtsuensis TaxID=364764 RepID=UPI0003F99647|nr:SpoIIE family protein phosphatase [Ferrimonas futtsuensis]